MAKSTKPSSSTEPVMRKTSQKTQKKSESKKSPKQKVFKIIGEVQGNVGLEFFEGITKIFSVGKNFSYSLPHESDSSVILAAKNAIVMYYDHLLHGTKGVQKEEGWSVRGGTSTTTSVADVGEKEVSAQGVVGATQGSEAVAAKGKSKPRPQCRRRKDVISPAVGENLVEEEAGDGEGLEVTKRRHLRKVASTEVAAAVDSEETESDEDVRKLASDSGVN
ncbi:hypothetical protein Dimus_005198 [Dionaea muscipula]